MNICSGCPTIVECVMLETCRKEKKEEDRLEFSDDFKPNVMLLERDEIEALNRFFFDIGYISTEFHPEVIKLARRIEDFLK